LSAGDRIDAAAVLGLLDLLEGAGIRAWVAGGWAVDAVVGRQTRPHGDLDLAVDAAPLEHLFALLGDAGFVVTVDWLPSRVELTAPDGRRVDLHPVVFRADGGGTQSGLDGSPAFDYPANGFATGTIAGRMVPCLSIAQQLRFREGYPPRDVDIHDLALLHDASAAQNFGSPRRHADV
jgi:lincosamide nucleotidyltransferase A/C/D/E